MKVQVHPYVPDRYRFAGYVEEGTMTLEVDRLVQTHEHHGLRGAVFTMVNDDIVVRELVNAELSMMWGPHSFKIQGFREDVREGEFFSGIYKRELWIVESQ